MDLNFYMYNLLAFYACKKECAPVGFESKKRYINQAFSESPGFCLIFYLYPITPVGFE